MILWNSLSKNFRLGLFFFLRVVLLGVGASAFGGRRSVRFIRVVSDVPARSFELHGGRGNHLLNFAATLRTLLNHPVGEFLDFLKAVTALLAFIFVKRHGF